jgi:hypothetical protein
MMTRNQSNEREQLDMLTIDQLVPDDHLVRKVKIIKNSFNVIFGNSM